MGASNSREEARAYLGAYSQLILDCWDTGWPFLKAAACSTNNLEQLRSFQILSDLLMLPYRVLDIEDRLSLAKRKAQASEILAIAIPALMATDDLIKVNAAKILKGLGTLAQNAVPHLEKLLQSANRDVRNVAIEAIGFIEKPSEQVEEIILRAWNDSGPDPSEPNAVGQASARAELPCSPSSVLKAMAAIAHFSEPVREKLLQYAQSSEFRGLEVVLPELALSARFTPECLALIQALTEPAEWTLDHKMRFMEPLWRFKYRGGEACNPLREIRARLDTVQPQGNEDWIYSLKSQIDHNLKELRGARSFKRL